jgi:hypothetical protein
MQESEYLKRPDAAGYLKVLEALRQWDPIGVLGPGSDCPRDEYDRYAPQIVRVLDMGTTADHLAQVLQRIAEENMHVKSNPARDKAIAGELVAFWKAWRRA